MIQMEREIQVKNDLTDTAKTSGISLLAAFAIVVVSKVLASDFVFKFLDAQLLLILPALLAISASTMGIVMTKLTDLAERYDDVGVEAVVQSMRWSTVEQLAMIAVAAATLVLKYSDKVQGAFKIEVANTVLVAVFIYALTALYDTTNAVYLMIEPIVRAKKSDNSGVQG